MKNEFAKVNNINSNMRTMKIFIFLTFSTIFLVKTLNIEAKTIYYVTQNGTGDGSSWAKAANSIQAMNFKTVSGDEVWVAKGTYYPSDEKSSTPDARSRTFLLKKGAIFYGGFSGSETQISQRVLADLDANGKIDSFELVNKSILSGDIDGVEDVWTKTANSDGTWQWVISGNSGNCYSVVTSSSNIDGFTVVGGNSIGSSAASGGGIYCNSSSSVTNCTVSNCSAGFGGGIYSGNSSSITNCAVSNCSAASGGGIYSSNSSSVTNSIVSNCSASNGGGGISSSSSSVSNCTISNCSAGSLGGGIYSAAASLSPSSSSSVNNCTVSNCSAGTWGGGIFSAASSSNYTSSTSYSSVTNCAVSNCSAGSRGGGIYSSSAASSSPYSSSSSSVTNCAVSNCSAANDSDIYGGNQSNCIFPVIAKTFISPTSFIGRAATDVQKSELLTADWRLREGSLCINAGSTKNISSTILTGSDLDNNPRVAYGIIDIGAYEYKVELKLLPVVENFNNWTDFNESSVLYRSANLNTLNDIKWTIENQRAVFSWKTNLTSNYVHPFFTYQIDATNSTKVYLRYDMYFVAYSGTISSPLDTEKLNVQYSTDLISWSTIATYTNANGTISNSTYKHDLSTQLAGRKFFIRFIAIGVNSNRIEKWELDNIVIDTNGLTAGEVHYNEPSFFCTINQGVLNVMNFKEYSTIKLFDLNGRLLNSSKTGNSSIQFALPTHGVYLVRVESNSVIESKKVVW